MWAHRRHVRVLGRLRIDPPLPLFPVLISRRPVAPVLVTARRRSSVPWDGGALQECQGHPRVDPVDITPSPSFTFQESRKKNPFFIDGSDLSRVLPPRHAILHHLRPVLRVWLPKVRLQLFFLGHLAALARERVLAQQDATQDLIVSHRMAERHQPMLRDLAGEVRDGPLVVEVILLFSRF